MERFKKALRLTSAERAPFAEVPSRDDGAEPPEPAAATVVEYTQTRIFRPAPGVREAARIIDGRGRDPVTRSYKLLRTRVMQRMMKEGWQTVAVVSPSAGEGKTLTAINLGISIAAGPHHTALLVDLDWLQPSVHTCFGYRPEQDICSYLRGEHPLSAALVSPGVPRFCFAPCRDSVADSSEQLAGLGDFVRELKSRYVNRIVLFDLPPLLVTDDALSFLPHVDCALLVVQEDRTCRDDVVRSLELIGEQRLLGAVVNRSRQALPKY